MNFFHIFTPLFIFCTRAYNALLSHLPKQPCPVSLSPMSKIYDVAVIGANPAGCAAAHRLASRGLSVALVDCPSETSESPIAEWAPGDFFKQRDLPKSLIKASGASEFHSVCYHNADFSKHIEYKSRSTLGYFVRSDELRSAMRAAAQKAKVEFRHAKHFPEIHIEEEGVRLFNSNPIQSRLLIIAQGQPAAVLNALALPIRTVAQDEIVAAGLDIPIPAGKATRKIAGSMHVVECPERTEIGIFFVAGSVIHVRIVSSSPSSGTQGDRLSAMLAGLQQAELLPANLPLGRAKGAVWHPPAGAALDMETHVAKRCLLVGTAGGFAESVTGHTLMPSVRSALLGAEVTEEALAGVKLQEILMKFKTHWRKSLANYLRPPSTSLQMLLPLLFANQNILGKFTAALISGKNI